MARKKKSEEASPPETTAEDETPALPAFKDTARESIYASYDRKKQEDLELEAKNKEPESPAPPENEPETPETPAAEVPPVEAEAPGAEGAPPALPEKAETIQATPTAGAPQKYPVNVNGQMVEFTAEELARFAQQQTLDAAAARQAAQSMMFGAQFQNPPQNSQPNPAVDSQPRPSPVIPTEELRDIAKRLDFGSEEERIEALYQAGKLFAKMAGPGNVPPQDQIVNTAVQQAVTAVQMQNESTVLANEYKDIVADPPLAYATDLIASQLAHKYAVLGQPKPRLDLLREAGNIARERYLRPAPPQNTPPPAPNVVPMTDRIERKRAAPQPPAAASRVATETPQADVVSPAAVIAAMRKARGQPVY